MIEMMLLSPMPPQKQLLDSDDLFVAAMRRFSEYLGRRHAAIVEPWREVRQLNKENDRH